MDSPQQPPPLARSGVHCQSCGYDLLGVRIGDPCPECGTPIMQFVGAGQSSGKAVASLVLGIVSLVTCSFYGLVGMPCAILAIHYAKKAELAIQCGNAPVTSQSLAKAGRVCGWVGVGLNGLGLALAAFWLFMVLAATL